jgi:hypothetical protein
MRLSQRSETELADLALLDRRTLLRLCAASLSAAALGTTALSSCTSGPYKGGIVFFQEVNRSRFHKAAGEIARTLLSLLEQETTRDMALTRLDRVLKEAEVWDGALAGPLATVDQLGYGMLVSAGDQGFLTLKVYNDSKFVQPLIVRRGVATERSIAQARAANCCMTAGLSTYNTAGEFAVTDSQADDPCASAGYIDLQDLSRQRRTLFPLQDVVAYTEVVRKCIDILDMPGDPDVTELYAWLAQQQARFPLDKMFVSAHRDGEVLWVDWLLLFRNGAVGMAQVAKGKIQPVYRLGDGPSPLTQANIDTTPTETNIEGVDIAFPRVSLVR